MCNRYKPGERVTIREFFGAKLFRDFNDGPRIAHPKDPGWVVRPVDGGMALDQMTWGFPAYLRGKTGQPLKVKPVNNARFDKLGGYWKQWAVQPAHRCLIPTAAYAEAERGGGPARTHDHDLAIGEGHADIRLGRAVARNRRMGTVLHRHDD